MGCLHTGSKARQSSRKSSKRYLELKHLYFSAQETQKQWTSYTWSASKLCLNNYIQIRKPFRFDLCDLLSGKLSHISTELIFHQIILFETSDHSSMIEVQKLIRSSCNISIHSLNTSCMGPFFSISLS